jgi:hypothetical protein
VRGCGSSKFNLQIPAVLSSERARIDKRHSPSIARPCFWAWYDEHWRSAEEGRDEKRIPKNGGSIRKVNDSHRRRTAYLTVPMTLLLILAVAPAFLPRVSAQATSYSFNLLGPNTAMAPEGSPAFAGDTLTVTGSGSFDTSAKTISGGGSYQITTSGGVVVDKGTYVISMFVGFTPYGGPSPGFQGGKLALTVTATSSLTGATTTNIQSTVTCLVGSPPQGAMEGVTSGVFSQSVIGKTLFHINT